MRIIIRDSIIRFISVIPFIGVIEVCLAFSPKTSGLLTLTGLEGSERGNPLDTVPLRRYVVLSCLWRVPLLSYTLWIRRVVLSSLRLMSRCLLQTSHCIIWNPRRIFVQCRSMAYWENIRSVFKLWTDTLMPVCGHIAGRVLEKCSTSRWFLRLSIKEPTIIVLDGRTEATSNFSSRRSEVHICCLSTNLWLTSGNWGSIRLYLTWLGYLLESGVDVFRGLYTTTLGCKRLRILLGCERCETAHISFFLIFITK